MGESKRESRLSLFALVLDGWFEGHFPESRGVSLFVLPPVVNLDCRWWDKSS